MYGSVRTPAEQNISAIAVWRGIGSLVLVTAHAVGLRRTQYVGTE
jgi:hypothetical protein